MKKDYSIKRGSVFLLTFLSLLIFSQTLFAQQRQITGIVIGLGDGKAIPGAVIKVKGKAGGTSSDANGAFVISAAAGDVLQISSIGYVTKEATVGAGNKVNVSLPEDNQNLEEVVVVGYGVQK